MDAEVIQIFILYHVQHLHKFIAMLSSLPSVLFENLRVQRQKNAYRGRHPICYETAQQKLELRSI